MTKTFMPTDCFSNNKTNAILNVECFLIIVSLRLNTFKVVLSHSISTSQARVFIPSRATAKTLVQAGHVGLYEFIA